ncbi:hypothetical protein N324_06079, partial [Chlamydotis macqueenii]
WGSRTGWRGSPESSSLVLCAQEVLINAICTAERGLTLYNQALLQSALMRQSRWRVDVQRAHNNSANLKQIVSPGSKSFVMKSAL